MEEKSSKEKTMESGEGNIYTVQSLSNGVTHPDQPSTRANLYLSIIIVDLLYLGTGCALTWPSPVLRMLDLDPFRAAWVGSCLAMGAIFGPIVNSLTLGSLGRRPTLILNGLLFLSSWVILATTSAFPAVVIGRFISGVAVGLSFNSVPVYLMEVADDKVRQAATSLAEFFIGIGYMIVYGLGHFISYTYLQVACLMGALCFLGPALRLPESPYFLVSKGREREARTALAWFRGTKPEHVSSELACIQEALKGSTDKESFLSKLSSRVAYRRALYLSLVILFIQQLTGVNVVVGYTELIFSKVGLPVAPYQASLMFGVANLFSSALAPPLVRRWGSKVILLLSNFVMATSLAGFAAYLYLEKNSYNLDTISFLPVVTLVVYNIFFCIGGGPLPWSILAELSPPDARGTTVAIVSSFSWFISFILVQTYPPVSELAPGPWPFFVFLAASLAGGSVIIWWLLPDTRGLSQLEVQRTLSASNATVIESIHL